MIIFLAQSNNIIKKIIIFNQLKQCCMFGKKLIIKTYINLCFAKKSINASIVCCLIHLYLVKIE